MDETEVMVHRRPLGNASAAANKLVGFAVRPASRERVSAIIEIRQEPLRFVRKTPSSGEHTGKERRVLPLAMPRTDAAASEAALASVLESLRRFELPSPPVVLHDARLVIAEVTGAQLRTILEWPEVVAVRPNRVHHTAR